MEILFQTVVSGYLLHFVQDGSSKNALGKSCLRKNNKHPEFGKTNPDQSPLTPIALRRALCMPFREPPHSDFTTGT